jgi:hypothetical protein
LSGWWWKRRPIRIRNNNDHFIDVEIVTTAGSCRPFPVSSGRTHLVCSSTNKMGWQFIIP